ncbi:MAG TPA: hypothetical protein VFB19_10895 [Mycobacterium sp.]|nr:hypothetical protein [Mycobacterium sp.]
MADAASKKPGKGQDPFAAAYRAYLEAMKKAWEEVDVEEMVSKPATFNRIGYSSAGSVSTIGTFACVGTAGGCLGSAGTFGSIWLSPDE